MPMNREEYTELLKKISETGGDTDDMMEALKRLQDDYDEREGMLRSLGEGRDDTVTYAYDDVYDSDGVKWSEKYDDARRRYRDRFFSTTEEVKEAQEEDIIEDTERPKEDFEDLFEGREGDYK